jgi:hypothetical protein
MTRFSHRKMVLVMRVVESRSPEVAGWRSITATLTGLRARLYALFFAGDVIAYLAE